MKSTIYLLVFISIFAGIANSQSFNVSDSLNSFGLNLLGETINQADASVNVALSTYTVWTLMAVISEGSRENTARQLERTLKIPSDKNVLRYSYQNLSRILQTASTGIVLELNTAIFTNEDFAVKKNFETIAKQYYDVTVTPVNFRKPANAVGVINKYVAEATRNRLPTFVEPADVRYAQVFLASTLYFKGLWNMPFNKSATHRESFYDEKNNKIGEVEMMYQFGLFPYSRMEILNSYVIELSYGNEEKMSMVVLLPFKGESVTGVLNLMARTTFSSILNTLDVSRQRFSDEKVHVYLPKFKVASDFNMNIVLSKIGIKDVFDIDKANLLDMFDQYLYLSRFIQKAEIEVDEEGTVAIAAAGASLENKSAPPRFRANRPFLYFIVDKPSGSIVFCGKVSDPNTLK